MTSLAVWLIIGLYFLPLIIAMLRNTPHTGSIAVLNVFLGWTLIGWVVALALAVRSLPATARSEAPNAAGTRT